MKTGRMELKYYINYIDYLNLESKLSNIFLKDRNTGREGYYQVRSLYFDNKSNNGYFDKINGVEFRSKYRIRIYDLNENPIKLEIKSKLNTLIFKESIIIVKQDINKLILGDYSCLLDYKNSTASKIYGEFTKDFYKPVIIIDYKRNAYYLGFNDIRVTFDFNIQKEETNLKNLFNADLNLSPVLDNGKIIMEVKFNGFLPLWVKHLLRLPRFEMCAISKYTLSRYIEN